jgi:hypothetical protein
MRYSVFVLPALAALGTNFGAHARAIHEDKKNGGLVDRSPMPLPIFRLTPHVPAAPHAPPPPKPLLNPVEPGPRPLNPNNPVEPVPRPLNPNDPIDPAEPATRLRDEQNAKPVTNPERLNLLKQWQCGIRKRSDDLSKRAPTFGKADMENPEKYLEWLQTTAKIMDGEKMTPDKIVFYTNGKFEDADAFTVENEGYKHFEDIFERETSLYDDWGMKRSEMGGSSVEAQSQALAKYAKHPIVFGAQKSKYSFPLVTVSHSSTDAQQAIQPGDKTFWAIHEYPYMQEAGTITKMKDGALKPTDVEFTMDPPPKPASC